MRELASKEQLRLAFLRWAVVTVPFVLLLGFLSARSVPVGSVNRWYAALIKPPLTPPDWAFPVAWILLYVLMGIALAMVIHARGSAWRGTAIILFFVQLAINLSWTPVFFGLHRITVALIIIGAMFVAALATTLVFARIRGAAAGLMVPYLAWIVFAGYLTYQIGLLNPNAETLAPGASSTQILE
ncbi:MAG: tryptophan-rich sensory protein [Sphingomonas sp.]|nr:tryptophan-rich sensory protein [Sphingomonas sp.]